MDVSDAILQNFFGFASALIGAVVGGVFTLRATDRAIREGNEKEQRQDERNVQNLLDALGVELSTLWNFHQRRVGQLVEDLPAGEGLNFYYPLTQDYFSIYNSNASQIGAIQDPALRETIVVCYNKCKKVVDGFKYNNDMVQAYNSLLLSHGVESPQAEAKKAELAGFAAIVKEDHYELKGYVERMLLLLEQRRPEAQALS